MKVLAIGIILILIGLIGSSVYDRPALVKVYNNQNGKSKSVGYGLLKEINPDKDEKYIIISFNKKINEDKLALLGAITIEEKDAERLTVTINNISSMSVTKDNETPVKSVEQEYEDRLIDKSSHDSEVRVNKSWEVSQDGGELKRNQSDDLFTDFTLGVSKLTSTYDGVIRVNETVNHSFIVKLTIQNKLLPDEIIIDIDRLSKSVGSGTRQKITIKKPNVPSTLKLTQSKHQTRHTTQTGERRFQREEVKDGKPANVRPVEEESSEAISVEKSAQKREEESTEAKHVEEEVIDERPVPGRKGYRRHSSQHFINGVPFKQPKNPPEFVPLQPKNPDFVPLSKPGWVRRIRKCFGWSQEKTTKPKTVTINEIPQVKFQIK
jgi:hypothetical protein